MRLALAENELAALAVPAPCCIRCPADVKTDWAAALADPCCIRFAVAENADAAATVADPSW